MPTRMEALRKETLMIDGYQASKGAQLLLEIKRMIEKDPDLAQRLNRAIDFHGDDLTLLSERVAYFLAPAEVTIRALSRQLDEAETRLNALAVRKKGFEQLVSLAEEVFVHGKAIAYENGVVGNCRWILHGPHTDSPSAGQLHLADNEQFVSWAASCSVVLDLGCVKREGGNVRDIVSRALTIYV